MKNNQRRRSPNRDNLWNVMTIVMLLGTMCSCFYFFALYRDPYSLLNFFPPDPATPTPSPIPPTPLTFPATWTPTVTQQPSPSNTKRPTITLEPSNTPFSLATATSENTATITPKPTGVPYGATVSYHDSTTFRPDTDCTKLIIAGRVMDAKNKPVIGLIVKMGGGLPGKSFTPVEVKLTGLATAYGPSGFEFDTGVEPVASSKTLWVQLFDQTNALSTPLFVDTFKDCKKNLVLVTFQEK